MIPLRDANPTTRTPIVTLGLIGACTAVFVAELSASLSGPDALDAFIRDWGAIPAAITAALGSGDVASPAIRGILTSQFLHGGWLHLVGNMLFLWIFGNNIEDRFGRLTFLAFYLFGGTVAALAQAWIDPSSTIPVVGASGAIAATLGAYLVLYPGARITSLIFLGFFYQVVRVRAVIVLGFWFLLQFVDGVASLGATSTQGGIAFFAHIGGFASGVVTGLVVAGTGWDRRRRHGSAPVG